MVKMEKEEQEALRTLNEKVLKGFRLLFICLSIGIITQMSTGWNWVEHLIKAVTFGMTAILIIIIRKIEKKREKEEHDRKVEEEKKEGK